EVGDTTMTRASIQDSIERGTFSDGVRVFSVRASSDEMPDSFQVYLAGSPAEIVLVVSWPHSGIFTATWWPNWLTASEGWRQWCEAEAFMVFYNGTGRLAGRTRVCDG